MNKLARKELRKQKIVELVRYEPMERQAIGTELCLSKATIHVYLEELMAEGRIYIVKYTQKLGNATRWFMAGNKPNAPRLETKQPSRRKPKDVVNITLKHPRRDIAAQWMTHL
jgi:predicted ArsR family transcriptional regulator